MIKIFKSATPSALIVLLFYLILVNLNLFLATPEVIWEASAPLSNWLLQLLALIHAQMPILVTVLFVALVLIQAVALNYIIELHKLFPSLHSLVALSLVFLIALFNQSLYLAPPFWANFLLLFALHKILSSYNDDSIGKIFDAGFAIGIASLFYMPAIIMTFFFLISLTITRIFNWREWVIAIASVFIPYFLLGTWFFWNDGLLQFLQEHFLNWTIGVSTFKPSLLEIITKGILLLVIIMAGLSLFQKNFLKIIVRVRKYTTIFVYMLSVSFLSLVFVYELILAPIGIMLMPIAFWLAYTFYEIDRDLVNEGIHLTMLLVLFYFQYAGILI